MFLVSIEPPQLALVPAYDFRDVRPWWKFDEELGSSSIFTVMLLQALAHIVGRNSNNGILASNVGGHRPNNSMPITRSFSDSKLPAIA